MSVWHETIAPRLRALHLDTIRAKILLFTVLATVIPTLFTTFAYNTQDERSLNDKIAQALRGASSETAREMDLWLTERLNDLRGSASSYIVTENLGKVRPGREGGQALSRLRDYLGSVRQRSADYEALLVTDARGRMVTTSAARPSSVTLPPDRLTAFRSGDVLLGDPYWDAALGRAVIVLAVPIREADGRLSGAFGAKLGLRAVADILQRLSREAEGDVYLMIDQGRLVLRSRGSAVELIRPKLPKATLQALFDEEGTIVTYKGADGEDVLGTLRRVPQLRWAAVAETPRVRGVRSPGLLRTLATLFLVVLLAGLIGYVLGLWILRPLERLTTATAQVAAGDLAVELPVGGGGEAGHLAQVLRNLVARLRERESQGELERLSVTDPLTGLYNRRHLMGTLANEVQRSRRTRRTFAVLLMDVDHFKQYNDTLGHLAGDAALTKIADILRKMTRAVDSVARYGGEEFLVMLLETTVASGAVVAERIRARVAAEAFGGGKVTLSIGVAECPAHGDTPEELIASADAAMYQAKGEGRDRVVAASGPPEKEPKKRRRKGES